MASNIDVTLKRYNGTDYDLILPTTHLGQLYTDNTLTTTLSSYLDNRFAFSNTLGVADGIATLDSTGKLANEQIPDFLFGGLKYFGNVGITNPVGGEPDLTEFTAQLFIDRIIEAAYSNYGGAENPANIEGVYFSLQSTGTLSFPIESGATGLLSNGVYFRYSFGATEEEHGNYAPQTITIEANDWIVISKYNSGDGTNATGTTTGPVTYQMAIVNNQYGNASADKFGVVALSNITDLNGASGNKVITAGVLAGLVGAEQHKIAAGDHLHDDRYYTETEIQNYFDGTTAITGYNKDNWDTAFGWGNHADEGYLTEESLADLTDVTLTSAAENDILRYTGSGWVNDSTYKPILYGTGQTSSITGAIIIETD